MAKAPNAHDVEEHFTASETIRDIVIGMADGLTVPFALAAGLTGAVDATRIIIAAGLAEIAAGSIAMGLGGFLAARGDAEHYASRQARATGGGREAGGGGARGLRGAGSLRPHAGEAAPVVEALRQRPEAWVDFMMRFELGLEAPNPSGPSPVPSPSPGRIVGGLIPRHLTC